jgi:serine protease Do
VAEDRHPQRGSPLPGTAQPEIPPIMKRTAAPRPHSALLLFAVVAGALLSAAAPARAADNVRETPVVRAVETAMSSVVNIFSEKTAPLEEDSLFGGDAGRKVNGMGTGLVLDERGYIVTNHHVVDGVDSLKVTLADGSTYMARVVSTDPARDLAVIKVEPGSPLDVMPLGTSSDIMLGETAIAIGNAFGYERSVSVGIVSAVGRDVEVNEHQRYENLIQTDAAINPGNSGGPLLNLEGKVIGINVAIRAGAQRIGFAIPIDDARRVVAQLIAAERVSNVYHGIRSRDRKSADSFTLLADEAAPGSPAAQCGFAKGDVIRRIGKMQVADGVDLERAMIGRRAGERIECEIDRDGESQLLTLVIGESRQVVAEPARPQPQPVVRANNDTLDTDRVWLELGLRLERIADTEVEMVGPRYRGGLRVLHVREASPAARNGIRRGDLLVGLHIWETLTPDNVEYVLDHPQFRTFNPIKFYIVRGRETLYGHLRIASAN